MKIKIWPPAPVNPDDSIFTFHPVTNVESLKLMPMYES